MAMRGVFGGYLDTIIYESSLLAERRGEDLIASQHSTNIHQTKRPVGSARLRYQHRLQAATHRVMATLARGLKGPV